MRIEFDRRDARCPSGAVAGHEARVAPYVEHLRVLEQPVDLVLGKAETGRFAPGDPQFFQSLVEIPVRVPLFLGPGPVLLPQVTAQPVLDPQGSTKKPLEEI